ncbi:DUF1339 domain protein [Colletotrichum tabaci]|uniref:DUF1339 domain protein n=1 Tax=Colletotrichum tabaci TaxID=1209068 RepID=A0AAV9T336_9PEZI
MAGLGARLRISIFGVLVKAKGSVTGRWKTFANEAMENEFQVRGSMCWYQHILVAAVEANKAHELRLYSRETGLDSSQVLHTQPLPAPVVLVTTTGEDSLLVYTYENLLYHFIFAPTGGSIRLVQLGQIAFHGIVRSPARVRGLSWILPDSQLVDGDPSQDVAVASVLFLVDAKLVLLQPSFNSEGNLKYDMKVIAQNVEFHTHLFLPDTLRFFLTEGRTVDAVKLSEQYQKLEYFAHALEVLLHKVLDDEVDSGPSPEEAILPRVLSLLSSFKQYLDIVVQCTRKTEVRQWRTLFAYLPPVQELFEESLQRGSLKTAGGYLIILHTLDELGSASEQTVRLLSRAMKEGDWDLCKELARFLAAMDETGDTLREAMEGVNITLRSNEDRSGIMSRLDVPNSRGVNGLGLKYAEQSDEMESEGQSTSDAASFSSDGR